MNARQVLLLLLLLPVACSATGNDDQPVIAVVLQEDGDLSLDGQPAPDAGFPEAYAEAARRYRGDSRTSRSRTRIDVEDPAGTTWSRLLVPIVAYAENHGEALYVQGQEVFFPICWECETRGRHQEYTPIRIAEGTRSEALRRSLEPAAGGTALVSCQPTCPLDLLIDLLSSFDEKNVAYRFSTDPPEDTAAILIVPDPGEEEEPSEEDW
jgi:hypothetical protein